MQETQVQSLGRENPLEKEMATHSSILAWEIPWTVAHQASLSIEFSRQEYWSGLPFPPPRDLPDPGIKPASPALAGKFFTTEPPGKPQLGWYHLAHMWRMLLCCNKRPLKCPKEGQVLSGFEHFQC